MTKGGPPLHLKMRVRLTRPMSERAAIKLIKRAIRTRYIPEGIELAWIDWQKGEGAHAREGEYIGDEAHDALLLFWNAITHPGTTTRIERVDE